MRILEAQDIYAAFLERLPAAPEQILLLDYDGTLAPFRTERDQAVPYPEVPGLITQIMQAGTRVVLISGRAAKELPSLATIHPHPEIWGSHGLERLLPDGAYQLAELPEQQRSGLALALRRLQSAPFGAEIADSDHLEQKPGSLAVHWRGLAARKSADWQAKLRELWAPLAAKHALGLSDFDGGIELRVTGQDKGNAVNVIQSEAGSGAAIAYLGDDLTDEDAFRALKGKGLTALVRPQYRPTAADVWLQPPHELLRFLRDWLRALGGQA